MNNVYQGDIWLFDPIKGNEIGKKIRPGVIISHNFMNQSACGLVLIIPLTSIRKGIESHVQINPPEGGLDVQSFALCEQIRSISKQRLVKKIGKLKSRKILHDIRHWILDLTSITD